MLCVPASKALPMTDLKDSLLSAGLIQFGHFVRQGEVAPVVFSFQLLPSYPGILRGLAGTVAQSIPIGAHFLVSTADSLPLGLAVSFHAGLPLVYSRGKDDAPTFDLIGAYDVGHPAVIVTNVHDSPGRIERLAAQCQRVGLEVTGVACLLSLVPADPQARLRVSASLDLPRLLDDLVADGRLTTGQAAAVRRWLLNRRHPG